MEKNHLRKWRLILGGDQNDGTGMTGTPQGKKSQGAGSEGDLSQEDIDMDKALTALYDSDRSGGLGSSSPNVARWLGDIRKFFPSSVVKVMQQDALEKLNLTQMLTEPEMLESVTPDVELVATLMSLGRAIPEKTKDTARMVVRKVVEELVKKLTHPMQQAVKGALNKSARRRNPKYNEIDWNTTIRKNLKHYQAKYKTIIPETRIGYGRKSQSLRDVVLCLDQSGSMGTSVIYSGIFGSVMASLPSVSTKMVVFDTAVVDLTEDLKDPVDLLFGVQLGGGTDINKALGYCQSIIRRPSDTVMLLITDLYEGGNNNEMLKRARAIVESGVQLIVLLALNDEGAPMYDHQNAKILSALGVPVFACSPDQFPDMMAAALSRQDLAAWAAQNEVVLKG